MQVRGIGIAGWQASPGRNPRRGAACCAVSVSRVAASQVHLAAS